MMPEPTQLSSDHQLDVLETMLHVASAAESALQQRLRPHRLSFARWQVLRAIAGQEQGRSIQQIADDAGVHRTSARAAIVSLESSGYVTVESRVSDRRCVSVTTTSTGRTALAEATLIIDNTDLGEIFARLNFSALQHAQTRVVGRASQAHRRQRAADAAAHGWSVSA